MTFTIPAKNNDSANCGCQQAVNDIQYELFAFIGRCAVVFLVYIIHFSDDFGDVVAKRLGFQHLNLSEAQQFAFQNPE